MVQEPESFFAKALCEFAASVPAGSIALACPPERLGPVPMEDCREGWKYFAAAAKMLSEKRLFPDNIAKTAAPCPAPRLPRAL